MDLNFLQKLGLIGAGPGVDPAAPQIAAPVAAPIAPAGVPGIPAPLDPAAQGAAPQAAIQAAPPMPQGGANILQSLNMGAPADAVQPQAAAAPRERRSILDTLGRAADVLAKVGGAEALYQPTLDARQDRQFSQQDRERAIQMDQRKLTQADQSIASNAGELGDAERLRLGQAVRGLQAITSANPQADIASVWPILAKQAGVPDERAAAIGAALTENPGLLTGLAGTVGAQKEFGLQPFYAKGADGALQAYQLGKDGSIQPVSLPGGATPIDPLKFVDTGGAMAGVGSRSGNVQRILPKTEKPGEAANRASRENIAAQGNRTRVQIAGMPARSKDGTAAGGASAPGGMQAQAKSLLGELRSTYDELDRIGAAVNSDKGAVGNVFARLRASGPGQLAEGAVGTKAQTLRDRINSIRPALMQSIAKATGMSGKQLDSNADVKLFMQTVTDPTKSAQANKAAIDGLEKWLAGATKSQAAAPARAAAAPARRVAPRKSSGGGKPSVTNW